MFIANHGDEIRKLDSRISSLLERGEGDCHKILLDNISKIVDFAIVKIIFIVSKFTLSKCTRNQ